jgi:hypothetical protein
MLRRTSAHVALSVFIGLSCVVDSDASMAPGPSEVAKILEQPTEKLAKGIDVYTPLRKALEIIAKTHGLRIEIDFAAFEKRGIREIGSQPVDLPPMPKLPLRILLRLLLDALEPDATFEIRSDRVLVVPGQSAAFKDESTESPDAKELAKLLSEPTDKLNRGLDRGTPLIDALQFIARIHPMRSGQEVPFVFANRGFVARGESAIVEHQIELGPTPKAPLGQILHTILDQASATYLIQKEGFLVIVPVKPKS